jgi:hypothetical protein
MPHQRPPFAATGLLDGHRLQRLPGAAFSVADRGVAFTECGQHLDRQTVETAILVGPPLRSTAWAPSADRRATC